MENQAPEPLTMPPILAFILTRRIPCAALILIMLMGMWLPSLLPGLSPALAILVMLFGMVLHILAPALVSLITFGGGLQFALQVSGITALAVLALSGFSLFTGTATFLLYGLLPIMAALAMTRQQGVKRSAEYVATGIGLFLLLALIVIATIQDSGIRDWVAQVLSPLFDQTANEIPAEQMQNMQMFRESVIAILPGFLAMGLWTLWWGNLALARHLAARYGFYPGEAESLLGLRFSKTLAYIFLGLMLLMNIATGDVEYLTSSAAIFTGGLLAAQGIAVAHSWLKARGLNFSIGLMYLVLAIQTVMIIPFVIVGLMDIWFDYRRNIPADGG